MHHSSLTAHLLALASAATVASATASDWNGSSGNWNDENKWIPEGVPTSAGQVTIASGSVILDTTGAEAAKLTLGIDSEAEDGGSLTVQGGGTGTSAGDTYVYAHSALTITGSGSSWSSPSDFGVQGAGSSVTVSAGGTLTTDDESFESFVDYGGSITVTGAGSAWSNPRLLNVYTGNLLFDDNATVTTGYAGLSASFEDNVSTTTVSNGAHWTTDWLDVGGLGTGTLNIESGGEVSVSQVLTIGATGTLNVGTGGAAGILSAGTVANGGLIAFNHTDAVIYGGDISDFFITEDDVLPGAVTKQGTGTLTLTGTNSWTGATNIEGGTLEVGYAYALPAESAVTVGAGATLSIAEDAVYAEIGSLAGAGTVEIGNGAQLVAGGDNTDTTFSGSITNPDGAGFFEKTGSGRLTLTGANSIGGWLDLCGCSVDNKLEIDGGSFHATLGVDVEGGTLSVVNGGSLEAEQVGVFGGIVEIGAGSTLDTETVFVVAGSLVVNGSLNDDSSTEINIGGILSGSGMVGDLVIVNGGLLSPGDPDVIGGTIPGTLHAGDTTWGDDGFYLWELNNGSDALDAKGVTYDWLDVAGTLDLTSTSADPFTIVVTSLDADNEPGLAAGFDPAHSYSWILVAADDVNDFEADKFAIDTSAFANLPNSDRFSIEQRGNSIALVYTAVPEPAVCGAAIGVGVLALAMARRRKR